jgi:AraC-like DNA-binding protein
MTKATRPVINAAADTVKARGLSEWPQCRCPRVASKDAVVIQSGWVFWNMPSIDGAVDRLISTADSVGLMLLVRGGVRIDWASHGEEKVAMLSEGMAEFRPADGHEHRYNQSWESDSLAICVRIPRGQFAKAARGRPMPGSENLRHLLGFHDPLVDHCTRRLASQTPEALDSIDGEAVARVLLDRLLELQGPRSSHRLRNGNYLSREVLFRIREYIDGNLPTAVNVSSLSRIAGLSSGHFTRTFRQSMGMSPGDYVRVRRVRATYDLLANSHHTLGHIAVKLGYSSQSHMNRDFIRITGLTPGYSRRRGLLPLPTGPRDRHVTELRQRPDEPAPRR